MSQIDTPEKTGRAALPIGGGVMAIIGFGLIVAGVIHGYMRFDYGMSNFTTQALVTGNTTHTEVDPAQGVDVTVYCPTVQYTAYPGNTFTWESSECTPEPIYEFGDYLEIVYPLASPQDAQLTSSLPPTPGIELAVGLGALGICLSVVGVALIAIGFYLNRKKTAAQPV